MNYRKVIAESWQYTQANKRLIRWFGFIPSLISTGAGIAIIVYQFYAFKHSFIFSNESEEVSVFKTVIDVVLNFIKDHVSWTVPIIITTVIVAICYFIFPTLFKAAAIQVIAREKNNQKVGIIKGLRYGLLRFLPLFEYHLLLRTFAFFSILLEMSFVVRNLGSGLFLVLLPIFILMLIVGLILNLLFIYTDFFIIIDGLEVMKSIRKSSRLVVMNWRHTFLVTMLMLIIGIRIILQAVFVFLIPALFILVSSYFAILLTEATSLIIGGIIGILAFITASYLNAIVDIFSYAVWTYTFLDLTSKKDLSARGKVES
jgi:hypothetical protein